ncbi:hypothetical protein [Sphingomonas bisphenolicum]|uniref:Uncharacterized protein n=1 Tax=Sphingomonas bisphenolicum TaxID=296544 RepID=A0ABN5WK80_9SPHN|nr:hypothetical protein [Sphingomonas bisphenolicum]BBF70685.1 hypothetical protein SBA_ch1_28850 [Sphingomonas bisphenolicum]
MRGSCQQSGAGDDLTNAEDAEHGSDWPIILSKKVGDAPGSKELRRSKAYGKNAESLAQLHRLHDVDLRKYALLDQVVRCGVDNMAG